MAEQRDREYARAVAKWLARLVYERPAVGFMDLQVALSALEALPHNPAVAKPELGDLCHRHGLHYLLGLLDWVALVARTRTRAHQRSLSHRRQRVPSPPGLV